MKYTFNDNFFDLREGDSLSQMKDLPAESIDLCVTDPPYKTVTGGDADGANSRRPCGMLDGNRKLFEFQNGIEFAEWMPLVYRVLKQDTHFYCFTNALNLEDALRESRNAGFQLHNVLVWEKNNATPSQFFMKNCEYVLFLRKGRAKYITEIGSSNTVHKFANIIGSKIHPTEKPAALLQLYIRNSSKPNDLVFDPFMGSASCALAWLNEHRNFIGIERDHEFFTRACARIADETNGRLL